MPQSTDGHTTSTGTALLAIFVAGLTFHVATLALGLLWGGDHFAIYQTRACAAAVFSQTTIFAHFMWALLAHPFIWPPSKDAAWRAHFASAVFVDHSIWAVLEHMQVAAQARPRVTLVNLRGFPDQFQAITARQGSRPLCLADTYRYYDLDRIRTRFWLVAESPVYRLVER